MIIEAEYRQTIRGVSYKEPCDHDGTPKIAKRVAGIDLFNHKNGPSLAERMACAPYRLFFYKAETARVASKSKMGGWNMLRWRLQGQDGVPMIYFMESCANCIRTIPALQIDEASPEDVKQCAFDHCGDGVRYLVSCRPYIPSTYNPPDRPAEMATVNSNVLVSPPTGGWLEDLENPAPRKSLSLVGKRIR
jgi:hypothetical protein